VVAALPPTGGNQNEPTQADVLSQTLDLRDRVQVKIIRKRLKLSPDELSTIAQKAGNSIAAISKDAAISLSSQQK